LVELATGQAETGASDVQPVTTDTPQYDASASVLGAANEQPVVQTAVEDGAVVPNEADQAPQNG
jgi:hypothetical protein